MKVKKFNIDFFELSFLIEACIPPVPIARTLFFQEAIDHYYHQLSSQERSSLYEWIMRSSRFQYGIEQGEELCVLFEARFNPDNQYIITTNYNSKVGTEQAFLLNSRYYTAKDKFFAKEYITNIEKL